MPVRVIKKTVCRLPKYAYQRCGLMKNNPRKLKLTYRSLMAPVTIQLNIMALFTWILASVVIFVFLVMNIYIKIRSKDE